MKYYIGFLLLLSCTFIFGQDSLPSPSVERHVIKGNVFLFPSFTHEFGLSKKLVLKTEIGTSFTAFIDSDINRFGVYPKYEHQLKYYNNLENRQAKGKRIENNSGSFFALMGMYKGEKDIISGEDRGEPLILISPVWGIQRTSTKGLSFLIEFGLGYDFGFTDLGQENGRIFPHIGVELGWVILRKSRNEEE